MSRPASISVSCLAAITGHKDLARDTGVVILPKDATMVGDAIVKVFIDHGDRTNRSKARLKYVLDKMGFDKFLELVEEKLGHPLPRVDADHIAARPQQNRHAHIGVHRQKQTGLSYIGVVLPVGKMLSAQIRELAAIAHDCGDGDLRLTVWQNLLISGIPESRLAEVQERIENIGLDWRASSIRAGLVACTGSRGCRFSASDTKGHAEAIAAYCETRVKLDQPINIHLTGCHNSCAQHFISDIGLLGARVPVNEEGDTVEGYHVFIGGGFSAEGAIGREIFHDVKAEDVPQTVERLLKAYLEHRERSGRKLPRFRGGLRCGRAETIRGEDLAMSMAPIIPPMIPENAPFSEEQRAWLNGFFRRAFGAGNAGCAEWSGARPRCRRRRGTLARSFDAARRAHETRGGAALAAPPDGRNGAAGLRPMRFMIARATPTRSSITRKNG